MKKKTIAVGALIILFVISLSTLVSAADLQDPYEAYGLEKGDEDIPFIMVKNPPDVIVLQPVEYRYGEVRIPLSIGQITLKKGEDYSFDISPEWKQGSTSISVKSHVTIKYRQSDDPRVLLETGHQTEMEFVNARRLEVGASGAVRTETHNKISTFYLTGWTEGDLRGIGVLGKENAVGNVGEIVFDVVGVQLKGGGLGNIEIDTDASSFAGETSTAVPAAIVIGLAGAAAAAAGAAAAGASGTTGGEEGGSSYKMVIYKDFGDKIRIGDEPVFVKARMVEVTARSAEVERPDLTEKIEILSPDNILTVGQAVMTGGYMQSSIKIPKTAAYSRAVIGKGGARPTEGTVSFRFTGEGGIFQNNVHFKIIGESKIKLAADTLSILGTSQESFELEYELVDFLMQPEVTLKYNTDIGLFKLETAKNKQGKNVIVATATEKAGQMNFQRFVHRYPCEIIAKNDKETVREKFELHLCYEGIGTAFENCKNNSTPEEIMLECFSDEEKDKRKEKAYRLPLAVMRWNTAAKRLEPDEQLAGKLQLEFTADTKSKNLPAAEAVKAVEDAKILAEVEGVGPSPVKADLEKKPAIYMIYPSEKTVAQAPEIEMLLTVSVESAEFNEMHLKAKLKPLNDYRAMIKWFIEYGKGTLVDEYLKIGSVNIYHGALDFIEDRVYCESNMPYDPKTLENHYEDGYLDVFRPNYVYLLDDSMPHKIGEFKKIQSLHHELCHAIEHQNRDVSGDKRLKERHSYFIQNLADVVKELADMERGTRDVESAAEDAIKAYYEVFFNPDNAQPQTFDWFGVEYMTQHRLFERYADFDVYARSSSVPDSRKQLIAKTFREKYFPGNLQGKRNYGAKFKETTGTFKDASWTFKCSTTFIGLINGITLEHPDYKFTVRRTPQWVPGTLKIQATYDVESIATGKTDTLEVELDGGSFDPGDYHYPKIDKFTVTWRATDKISDCIMGQPKVVSEVVKI
jgi:hypothetical protein